MTDNDRELLVLAAKAAGIVIVQFLYTDDTYTEVRTAEIVDSGGYKDWDPISDDGDAFRLAVRLELSINFLIGVNRVRASNDGGNDEFADDDFGADPCAATRRAIVRAAAAIGESMK